MYINQQDDFHQLIAGIGGRIIGLAAIFIPFYVVLWPINIDCKEATGLTVCQVR
jgi:hypothetical protein